MTRVPIVCDQCPVADRAVCAVLDDGERAELARLGQRKRYARGEMILAAGDPATVCATLISGAAKLSSIDAEGTERIVALIHPAGMMGQLFAPAQRRHVIALTDSEACLFPRDTFERLTADHPELSRRLLEEALRELDESRSLIDLISKRQADARLAALLLSFAAAASPAPCHDATEFDLPLTRGEIAQLLGITIETVSRNLVAMEREGLLQRKGATGIVIADRAGLAAKLD